MTRTEFAIKTCELLEQLEGGATTKHIHFKVIGTTTRRKATRDLLTKMAAAGVLQQSGVGKFRWKLTTLNWNRQNPFQTKTNGNTTSETEMSVTTDSAGKKLAMFENPCCRRCGKPIAKGSLITQVIIPVTGKLTWVHEKCSAVEGVEDAKESKKDARSTVLDSLNGGGKLDAAKLKGIDTLTEMLADRIKQLEDLTGKQAKQINELEKKQPPREVVIVKPDKKKVTVKGRVHPVFEQVMFHIQAGDHVMLVGPRGCGKSTLGEQVAEALGRKFHPQTISGGVTESKLFGRLTPDINTGKNIYHPTEFVEFVEKGGVFLLDEVDGGDPNVLLSINTLLANGMLTVDRPKNPLVKKHPDFVCLAAANTWGNGADRQYVGRNQQDSAFTERFVQLAMDYDKDLERALCPDADKLLEAMWKYRAYITANKLERTVSTRFICRAYNWMKLGKDLAYVEGLLFAGWRADEIKKAKGGLL